MNLRIEKEFTPNDINKIKGKRASAWMISFLGFIIFAVILYFRHKSSSFELFSINILDTIKSYFNVWDIVLHTFFVIFGYDLILLILKGHTNKDLKNKIKIVTKVKVIDKKKITNTNTGGSDSGGSGGTTYYKVFFEQKSDIKDYRIKRKYFDKIRIGDTIDLEYGKESKKILKIEFNSENIENKWGNRK